MAVSPSSSVQRARQQLAERLRDLRLDAGLTARALSVAAGWHEAKTSRIESAKQAASEADIQAWSREESVLRYRLGGGEVMATQLGYLLEATELPSMSLGVIPFAARGRPVWPLESFTVFDDARVHVELLSAQVTVTAPSEITLYVRAFEKLAELAVYGTQARGLITAAIDTLG